VAVVEVQTRSIVVGPTLLELADLAPASASSGYSLLNLARGGALGFDNLAVSELYSVGNRMRSVRDGKTKILLDENQPEAPLRWYDLSFDPSEQRARVDFETGAGQTAHLNFLKVQAQLMEAVSARPGAPTSASLPPSVLEALRANGYLGSEDGD
jgi:arylsulfatase A-like enzyme